MTKQEQLEKKVADTEAAFDDAEAAFDDADDAYAATHAARSKAKLELKEYLKEQQDNG
tara:strand:- start:16 stop:189 length:174 start_codon:yes stop_codon:yes gene_type:complete